MRRNTVRYQMKRLVRWGNRQQRKIMIEKKKGRVIKVELI